MHNFIQILEIFIKYTIIVGVIALFAMLFVLVTENNGKHKKAHYSSQFDLDSWNKRTHHIHPSER